MLSRQSADPSARRRETSTSRVKQRTPPVKIAFIQAGWHHDIVGGALIGFQHELSARDHESTVEVIDVAGAFEIPLHAQRLARRGEYAAIVAAAFVVDGGIYRHEFVAGTVLDALMRVQLETDTPVLSMVLTPHNFQETGAHRDFFQTHFRLKGAEAARACISTVASLQKLAERH
ncbi:MAG: 6,7-dimethyl-8-ribityllumazine synthase [Antricoccus sp.]